MRKITILAVLLCVVVTGTWLLVRTASPKLSKLDFGYHIGGEILEIADAIPPGELDYPDCLGIARVQVLGLLDGDRLPREILVAVPFVIAGKTATGSALIPGDRVELTLFDEKLVSERLRSTQRLDDTDNFSLDLFYASEVHIWKPSDLSEMLESYAEPTTVSPPQTTAHQEFVDTRSVPSRNLREAAIKSDIARIERSLAAHDGSWDTWVESITPWRNELKKRSQANGNGLLKNGRFFKLLSGFRYRELTDADSIGEAPSLDLIRQLHRELDTLGIDLIVVPFPPKEEVHADKILSGAPKDHVFAPERLRLLLGLLRSGIEVIDLVPPLRSAPESYRPLFYPYEDTHPADGAIRVAAAEIASRLDRYGFSPMPERLSLKRTQFTMPESVKYDHLPDDPTYPATEVTRSFGEHLPPGDTTSPVLLAGDSFTRCPKMYGLDGAGLMDHLAYESKVLPATLSINGSASQIMRNLAREGPSFLKDRTALVYAFSTSALFTQAHSENHPNRDWKPAPLGGEG